MKIDVSVILVNYNTKEITNSCIQSIINHTLDINYEIVLVDNCSQDGSKEYFLRDKRIKFIVSDINLGFGKANNLGLQHAKGNYIFFLNSDTILQNNAVKLLFDFMQKYEDFFHVGAVGCLLMNRERLRTHSYATFPRAFKYLKEVFADHVIKRFGIKSVMRLDDGAIEQPPFFQVDYVTGADIFASRKTLDTFGGFDPDFFMYFEETEMQYRWAKHGLQNFILYGPSIVHLEGASNPIAKEKKRSSFRREQMMMKSRILYFKKTLNPIAFVLFRAGLVILHIHILFQKRYTAIEKKQFFSILLNT